MGRLHVATPDAEIRADIHGRIMRAIEKGATGWTPAKIRQAEDYAVKSMERNRKLCRDFRL
jgi:hypothetical protein